MKLVLHFIHREARLDQDFMGYKFSKDEKAVFARDRQSRQGRGTDGQKRRESTVLRQHRPLYQRTGVSAGKGCVRKKHRRPDQAHRAEVAQLKQGMALPPKEITDKNGKTYNVVLQVSADRKGVEFVPDSGRRHERREQQTQGQKPSSWITADGRIKPLSKWCKVPMTQRQQADYAAGKVVELTNIPDKNGKLNTVYLQFNPRNSGRRHHSTTRV